MVKRNMTFIQDGKKRKTTYQKRKDNIMKKLHEITTLCGVEACGVIYSPFKEEPEIWPPSHEAVRGVLRRLQNMPVTMQTQYALTPADLVQKQIMKVRQQLREHEMKIREEEIRQAVFHMLQYGPDLLSRMNFEDYNDIVWVLSEMERQVDEQVQSLESGAANPRNIMGGNADD